MRLETDHHFDRLAIPVPDLASASLGVSSTPELTPLFRSIQQLSAELILDIVCDKIENSNQIAGLGIAPETCSHYLGLQRDIHQSCIILSKLAMEVAKSEEEPQTKDIASINAALVQLQQEVPSGAELLTSLRSKLDQLINGSRSVPSSKILLEITPNQQQVEDIARLQQATFMNPFDGRVPDIGLSTVSLGISGVKTLIDSGARINCAFYPNGRVAAFSIFFPPEAVTAENPYTQNVRKYMPDAMNVGMLCLQLKDSSPLASGNFDANFSISTFYQKLLFSTWLSLQNTGASQLAGFVHENNHKAALSHVLFGGAEIHFDQTVPTKPATLDLESLKAEQTPLTDFYLFVMDITGTIPPQKQSRQEAMQRMQQRWLENPEKRQLQLEQRLDVLTAELQLHDLLPSLNQGVSASSFSMIERLLNKVLAENSASGVLWSRLTTNDDSEMRKHVLNTIRQELPSRRSIEREILRSKRELNRIVS